MCRFPDWSSQKFQKKIFILERVQEQLMANETAQPTPVEVTGGCDQEHCSTSPDTEMHCQQMFLNAISRIDSNNPNVGKDEKAMRFFCLGLRYNYACTMKHPIHLCLSDSDFPCVCQHMVYAEKLDIKTVLRTLVFFRVAIMLLTTLFQR